MKRIVFSSVAAICIFWMSGLIYAQDTTLTVTSSGNVGIGTTSPVDKLEIEGGQLTLDGAGLLGAIRFRENDELRWTFLTASFIGDGDFRLRDETTGNDVMTFDSGSGNVGIGTTGPASRLHVHGNGVTRSDLSSSSTTDAIFQRFFHSTSIQGGAIGFDTNDNVLKLVHGGNFNTSTKGITIGSDGDVGIGTADPKNLLHINSPSGQAVLQITSDAGSILNGLHIKMASPSPNAEILNRSNGNLFLGTSAQFRMTIDPSGNVGIGTTNPTHPLEMASGAHVTSGGVWTDASSRQYKENISNLTTEEAVSALETLNPVKFNYKVDKSEEYVGFIAEDVPDLVAHANRKSLSPMDIVAVLTKVVQQQQKKIAALEARLNASQ